jgi:hypothetical protein
MDAKKIDTIMEAAWGRYIDVIETIADYLRSDVVIPACDKNGWGFHAGMNSWVFIIDGQRVRHKHHGEEYQQIVDLLSRKIPGVDGVEIGAMIKSYPEREE